MNYLSRWLDTTWKRVLAAAVLSGVIVVAVSAFAESSYVQTQKVQQESARGQHCEKWRYDSVDGDTQATCIRWPAR